MCHGIPVGPFKLTPRIIIGNSVKTRHLNLIKHPKVKCFLEMWFKELDWTWPDGCQPEKQKVDQWFPHTHSGDAIPRTPTALRKWGAGRMEHRPTYTKYSCVVSKDFESICVYIQNGNRKRSVPQGWQQIPTLVLDRAVGETQTMPPLNPIWAASLVCAFWAPLIFCLSI